MLFDKSVLRKSSIWNRWKTQKFKRVEILVCVPTSRISIEPRQSIYHFEDLQTRNRMQKTGARNIDFEARYDHLNFWLKIKSSKTVFGLYRSNQSPERNGSSVKNECLGNIYRSHIVGLHLEGTIFFGPWPLPDLLRGRLKVDRKCKNKLSSNEGSRLSLHCLLFAFFIILPNNCAKMQWKKGALCDRQPTVDQGAPNRAN